MVAASLKITREDNELSADELANSVISCTENAENPEHQSRHEILEDLEDIGVNVGALNPLSIEELGALLSSLKSMASIPSSNAGRPRNNRNILPLLSSSDKTILHRLVSSSGHASSQALSKELDIPLSTVQRRRKRLENNLIERVYLLKPEGLGWRAATLFVSTATGKTVTIGKEILEMNDMVSSVTRTMGENSLDLRVEVLFKTNMELLSLIEVVKSQEGVKNVIWTESLQVIGKNNKCYEKIIDSTG